MNCEKCKNRKATLFYADEGGGRHALCSVCGANQNKLGNFPISEAQKEDKPPQYVPSPVLLSLSASPSVFSFLPASDQKSVLCKGCGMSRDEAIKSGSLGCPDCYDAFSEVLFPALPKDAVSENARMPSMRRARLDRERTLRELKSSLRDAVTEENFELAVILRDKIRNLENT